MKNAHRFNHLLWNLTSAAALLLLFTANAPASTSQLTRQAQQDMPEEHDPSPSSVWNQQFPSQSLNPDTVPALSGHFTLQHAFMKLRDVREWRWNSMPEFPRRLTWLYPADGCYLRAELMVQKLREWGYPSPKQLFAFGDLQFRSPYEEVSWWYHVAPVYRVGQTLYVVDPSIDPERPLQVSSWLARLSTRPESLTLSLCSAGAVSPDDDCRQEQSLWDHEERDGALQEQLGLEWDELTRVLGHTPERELGDNPPWRKLLEQTVESVL